MTRLSLSLSFVLAGLLVCLPAGSILAQEPVEDSAMAEAARYVVRLPRTYRNFSNTRDTVAITLRAVDGDIAGFDLKIASDGPSIRIADILPGTYADSCGWEYFGAREVDLPPTDISIRSLWKVVGLAKASADTTRPACELIDGEVTAARIVIDYEPSIAGRDTIAALFFYWEDCRDNSLAAKDGIRMAISRQVHDYLQRPQSREAAVFPTRTGAPSQCVKLSAQNHPRRLIEFHNGGINLLAPPADSIPADAGSVTE